MRLRALGLVLVVAGFVVAWVPAGASAAGCPNEALREEQGSTFLPDCRAYELVSPADKAGNDVSGDATRTRVATGLSPGEPMAVQFSSLGAFGDEAGTGIGADYLSARSAATGTSGWSTHGITPAQEPLNFTAASSRGGVDPRYQGDLSEDLSHGVFLAWTSLSDVPNVSHVENLYLRADLRTPGQGSYELLTGCLSPPAGPCSSPLAIDFANFQFQQPTFVGASRDFGHVLFESWYRLTSDAPEQSPECLAARFGEGCLPRLYEWDHGIVRLAGVLPDGGPAEGSAGGRGAFDNGGFNYAPHAMSDDGQRVFFTAETPAERRTGEGTLYMRVGHSMTVQLNASERTDCADHSPCTGSPESDPGGPRPARFWDATPDGTRMFFTTSEVLTDSARATGSQHLYMYEVNAPAGHHLTLLDVGREPNELATSVVGVTGVSDDGKYVYFVDNGQLVQGKPLIYDSNHAGIFLWHDDGTPGGTLTYVGKVTTRGSLENLDILYDVAVPSQARVSPDGRHLVFVSASHEGLTGYDNGSCVHESLLGCLEVYSYSADDERLQCASCNPSGAPATVDASVMLRAEDGAAGPSTHLTHALSVDGSRVFFDTAEALVPGDVNGAVDAYEFDTTTGEVHLLSSGRSPADSYFMDASPDGRDVFIRTRERLVGWDVDGAADLYDVRVDGGFPNPVAAPACSGEACQGAGAVEQGAGSPASQTTVGAGNLLPAVAPVVKPRSVKRCAAGRVRKRVRGRLQCVVKRRAKGKARRDSRADVGVSRRAGR